MQTLYIRACTQAQLFFLSILIYCLVRPDSTTRFPLESSERGERSHTIHISQHFSPVVIPINRSRLLMPTAEEKFSLDTNNKNVNIEKTSSTSTNSEIPTAKTSTVKIQSVETHVRIVRTHTVKTRTAKIRIVKTPTARTETVKTRTMKEYLG